MSPSDVRRRDLCVRRAVEVCTLTAAEVIGDVEFLLGLRSYLQSVVCSQLCVVYSLNHKNFERLLTRRNPRSLDLLRAITSDKLYCWQRRMPCQQVPLLKTLLFNIETPHKKRSIHYQSVFESVQLPKLRVGHQRELPLVLPHVTWAPRRQNAFVMRRASVTSKASILR